MALRNVFIPVVLPTLVGEVVTPMKTYLSSYGLVLLAGFALFSSGCVAQYESPAPVTSYSAPSLPAAGTVALVMEFRGGEPTPQERGEVRALLADYFSQQGTVLVEDTYAADYLVHAVMERRNPENSAEWTVVSTDSARTIRSSSSDEFYWPGGVIEDDSYGTTMYSHVGFGVFYPVFFDLWSDPWRRGHVVLFPPMRPHRFYDDNNWRQERRRHEPARWQPERHPEWRQHGLRPGDDRRPTPGHVQPSSGDTLRRTSPAGDHRSPPTPSEQRAADRVDHRDQPSNTVQRPIGGKDHRAPVPATVQRPVDGGIHRTPPTPTEQRPADRVDHRDQPPNTVQRPTGEKDRRTPPPATVQHPGDSGDHRNQHPNTVQRPPSNGDHRAERVRTPQPDSVRTPQPEPVRSAQPERTHTVPPTPSTPHIAPHPQPLPAAQPPAVQNEKPRRDVTVRPGHQVIVNPPQPQPSAKVPSAPQVQPQPADRRAGTPERSDSGHDRRSTPKDQDKSRDKGKDQDKDDNDKDRARRP